MWKIKKLTFRVFKKKRTCKRLCAFIDEHYFGLSGWGKADKPVRPECSVVDDLDTDACFRIRFSRESMRTVNAEGRPARATEEDDCDFQAIFDIFNARRPGPAQSRIKEVERLVAAAETKEKFTACMLRFIAVKGLSDSDVYNKVFMDRRLFNHIRNNPDYQPSKKTALLIAVALKLTYTETQSLLETAGYTLTHCNKRDLIVEFFIREGNYNIFEINEMLEQFKQPLLMKCE